MTKFLNDTFHIKHFSSDDFNWELDCNIVTVIKLVCKKSRLGTLHRVALDIHYTSLPQGAILTDIYRYNKTLYNLISA